MSLIINFYKFLALSSLLKGALGGQNSDGVVISSLATERNAI